METIHPLILHIIKNLLILEHLGYLLQSLPSVNTESSEVVAGNLVHQGVADAPPQEAVSAVNKGTGLILTAWPTQTDCALDQSSSSAYA